MNYSDCMSSALKRRIPVDPVQPDPVVCDRCLQEPTCCDCETGRGQVHHWRYLSDALARLRCGPAKASHSTPTEAPAIDPRAS